MSVITLSVWVFVLHVHTRTRTLSHVFQMMRIVFTPHNLEGDERENEALTFADEASPLASDEWHYKHPEYD